MFFCKTPALDVEYLGSDIVSSLRNWALVYIRWFEAFCKLSQSCNLKIRKKFLVSCA
jgi:hypothetical protein